MNTIRPYTLILIAVFICAMLVPSPANAASAVPPDSTADRVYGQAGSFTTNQNLPNSTVDNLNRPSGVALDGSGGLYVADRHNHRVLYYLAGSTTATRVYGQLGDFTTNTQNKGGVSPDSLSYPAGIALDGNGGLYVADLGNQRVLYFAPTPDGDTTADRVYGQADFTSNSANRGSSTPTADSLLDPTDVAIDNSGGLYVTDSFNNRVLYFAPDGNTTADRVYGQGGSFTTSGIYQGTISANSFLIPSCLALDTSGGLYVTDHINHRVLYFAPDGNTTADRVYGQGGSFTTNTANKGSVSAASLFNPFGVALDSSGGLYVSDYGNHRVLYFAPTPDGDTTADRVYGQGDSYLTNTANKEGISDSSLNNPAGVILDSSSGGLYVADAGNSRILYYPSGATTATRVYGQLGEFNTNNPNMWVVTASNLHDPSDAALDRSGGLYVVDTSNSRVLYYPSGATTATRVYGQGGSFTTNAQNKGGISAASLAYPSSIALDNSGGLYVVDTGNFRVLYYPSGSTTATRVYGQLGDFTTATQNKGGSVSAGNLYRALDIVLDSSGGLYIADTWNNRVLYFAPAPADGDTTADRVYGQGSDFTTNTANKGSLSAASLNGPTGLALNDSGGLYVVDAGNNRMLYFAPDGDTQADGVYGQDTFSAGSANKGGAPAADTLADPNQITRDSSGGLYLSDYGNHRVLYYPAGSTTASYVYGQGGSLTTNTANKGGLSAGSLFQPRGLTRDSSGGLYVVDFSNHRVLYYQVAPQAQPDTLTLLEDSSPLALNVLANDSFDAATITAVTPGSKGAVNFTDTGVTYTPTANANGSDSFTYTLTNASGSSTATVSVTITPVNDAPTFTPGGNVVVASNIGNYSAPWASAITRGPSDESSQNLTFTVTTDNPALFAAPPAIGSDGTLTFTLAEGTMSGTANLTVTLKDSGGNANGGVDSSPARTFTITAAPYQLFMSLIVK